MPTTIDSAGITFNDTSTITSANTFITKPASPASGQVLGYNGSTWTGTSLSADPTSAKAWVTFDSSTAVARISASHNVSSVTRINFGRFNIVFANWFSTPNIVMAGSSGDGSSGTAPKCPVTRSDLPVTLSSYPVEFYGQADYYDVKRGSLVFFGN